jgi:hypothetical protein
VASRTVADESDEREAAVHGCYEALIKPKCQEVRRVVHDLLIRYSTGI